MLQKLVRDRLRTQPSGQHPGAEVLSAFAENALSAAERQAVFEHLSSCAPCRDIVFLAALPVSEQQQVFAAPKARPYFALRWGTLAACVVIGAVLLVSHRRGLQPTGARITSIQGAEKLAAQEKLPDDLEVMHDKQLAVRILPPAPAPPARGHAESKQSVAEPNAKMIFEDSGEINVARGAQIAPAVPPSMLKELPTQGRNMRELASLAPGAGSGSGGGADGNRTSGGFSAGMPVASNDAWKAEDRRASTQYGSSGAARADAPANPANKLLSYGYVGGTVFDTSGAVIPNAKVIATGPMGEKTAVSDGAGRFSFDAMAAGTYQLQVDATGFRKALSQVAVLSDKPATADFKLQPGASSETVTVQAAAAPAETPSVVNGMLQAEAETANSLQSSGAQGTTETAKKQKAETRGKSALANLALPQKFSLSSQGTVERSSDGGKTWVPVAVAEGSVFRAVASSGNQVWAAGNAGLVYHSLDNGQHWTQVIPLSNGQRIQADITQIQFPDSGHVVLRSATGQGWASADGGETWIAQ